MAGKTQIGTRAITKKMFGTREITKEVVNGVVVYEKQASGFSVTLDGRGYNNVTDTAHQGGLKINSAPSNNDDYDVRWYGLEVGNDTYIELKNSPDTATTKTITGVTKLYCWCRQPLNQTGLCKINNVDISNYSYSNPYEITISQDCTMMVMGTAHD